MGLKRSLFAVLLILIAASPFVELHAINHLMPIWSDSYSPWYAAKVAIHGANPYSPQVTRAIQTWMYGHPLDRAHPSFDLQAYVYPATAIPLFALSTWIPWGIIRVLFLAITPLLVMASCLYWVKWSEAVRRRRMQWTVALIATASVPSFWGIRLMQPTVLIFIGVTAVLVLVSSRHYGWAGAVLAITSVKPNLVFLLTAWLLVVMLAQRRWRFIAAFGAVFVALAGIAELIVPAWPWMWYRAIVTYSHHKVSIFSLFFGRYAVLVMFAAGVLLIIALAKLGSPHPRSQRFRSAISLLLAYTVCVIPNGPWMIYNEIFLIPPILYLLSMHNLLSASKHISRLIALGFTWLTILSTPVCALLLICVGSLAFVIRFPFSNFLLPIAVLVAAYLGCWRIGDDDNSRTARPTIARCTGVASPRATASAAAESSAAATDSA